MQGCENKIMWQGHFD